MSRHEPELILRLTEAELRQLKDLCPAETYPQKCPLFYRRHQPHGAFVVLEGQVRVEYKKKRRTEILDVSPGAMLGKLHALNDIPYDATAYTLGAAKLIFVPNYVLKKYTPDPHRSVA